MLKLLKVKNIALIQNVELELGPGLTLLTGETGAGKSILIDALGLLLGARASADLIRTGEELAVVEALGEPFRRLRAVEAALESLHRDRRQDERRREMLEYQASEIEKAALA